MQQNCVHLFLGPCSFNVSLLLSCVYLRHYFSVLLLLHIIKKQRPNGNIYIYI